MKRFLQHRSKRDGYDGWALQIVGADKPLGWTTCTTRREIRELLTEEKKWIRPDLKIVKVKITVELV